MEGTMKEFQNLSESILKEGNEEGVSFLSAGM